MRFSDRHAFLARMYLDAIDRRSQAIADLTARIEVVIEPPAAGVVGRRRSTAGSSPAGPRSLDLPGCATGQAGAAGPGLRRRSAAARAASTVGASRGKISVASTGGDPGARQPGWNPGHGGGMDPPAPGCAPVQSDGRTLKYARPLAPVARSSAPGYRAGVEAHDDGRQQLVGQGVQARTP